MIYLNQKAIKQFCHDHKHRITKKAIQALDKRVEGILIGAINLSFNHNTITDTEINLTKGNNV